MNEIVIKGKQNFTGIDIPVVLGGFGADKKCISDKTIAEIHNQPAIEIRRRITDNIRRFRENVDIIDLKQRMGESHTLEILLDIGYSKQAITQAEHIYILSERGYGKLVKIMDTDLAWEIYDNIMDEYFELREQKRQERLEFVNETVKILTDLQEKAGCSAEIQLLTAKTILEKSTGIVLPIMIQSDKQYYDTTCIARKVGIYVKSSGKPAEKAVNEIIRKLDISEDMYTETWESKGNWQGTVRKYAPDVINMVKEWCIENGYPDDIEYVQVDGKKKCYHVVWKDVA